METTIMVNGQDVPADLAEAYERAGSASEVRAAIGAYYAHAAKPTADGAVAATHDLRLSIARERAEAQARGAAFQESIRAGSLCATGCGGLHTFGARDALCAECRAVVRLIEAEEAATQTVSGGLTRRAAVEAYQARREAA